MGNYQDAVRYLASNRVRKGESPKTAARSDRMNALTDAVLGLVRGENFGRGYGIRKRVGPGGVVLSVDKFPAAPAAQGDPDIAFFISDASTTEGEPPVISNKVFVADGKINGTFPSGMGTSEYTLDLDNPADSLIYAGATFNPETLALTSRFLGVSDSPGFPESRVDEEGGFLYWLLGFTFFDVDDDFRVVMTRVGDINFELVYGSMNGRPALLPVEAGPGWLDLEQFIA